MKVHKVSNAYEPPKTIKIDPVVLALMEQAIRADHAENLRTALNALCAFILDGKEPTEEPGHLDICSSQVYRYMFPNVKKAVEKAKAKCT